MSSLRFMSLTKTLGFVASTDIAHIAELEQPTADKDSSTDSAEECWGSGYTEEVCCNVIYGPQGYFNCWYGDFTFERCCPEKCWSPRHLGWHTGRSICCDQLRGGPGHPVCWNGVFTFEACCFEPVDRSSLNTSSSCWHGSYTEEVCCDTRFGPRGKAICWDEIFTFEACCFQATDSIIEGSAGVGFIAQFEPSAVENISSTGSENFCWEGVYTEEVCCNVAFGPQGYHRCWHGNLTFERCCPQRCWSPRHLGWRTGKKVCCDPSQPVSEHPACWNGVFTFEACCFEPQHLSFSLGRSSCWQGEFTEAACCDANFEPRGKAACWDDIFTFEACCLEPADSLAKDSTSAGLAAQWEHPAAERYTSMGNAEVCWDNFYIEEVCCNIMYGPHGYHRCWHGDITFERCCPENCWSPRHLGWHTGKNVCCSPSQEGPESPLCWNGAFSFAACCSEPVNPPSSSSPENCWHGDYNEALCCNPTFGPRGNKRCWDDVFTFEACCIEKGSADATVIDRADFAQSPAEKNADIADSCWVWPFNAEVCCNVAYGPEGLRACWHGDFTFDRCCPKTCWSPRHDGWHVGKEICCDPSRGGPHNIRCWNDVFTFESCCDEYISHICSLGFSICAAAAILACWLMFAAVLHSRRGMADHERTLQGELGRLHVLDSAKFVFTALVVAVHNQSFHKFTVFIGDGHVRGLCFVSGLVRKKTFSRRSLVRLIAYTALPFLLWCLLVGTIETAVGKSHWLSNLFASGRHRWVAKGSWYLLGLICWELTSAFLSYILSYLRVSKVWKMPAACVIFAIGGYFDLGERHDANAGVIVGLLPIFVLGQQFPLHWLLCRLPRNFATAFMSLVLCAAMYSFEVSDIGQSFMRRIPESGWGAQGMSYTSLYCTSAEKSLYPLRGFFRMLYDLTKVCVILFVFAPRKQCWLSEFGQRTIYAYVLHFSFLTMPYLGWGLHGFYGEAPAIICALWPFALTGMLCSRWLKSVCWFWLEPTWFLEVINRCMVFVQTRAR